MIDLNFNFSLIQAHNKKRRYLPKYIYLCNWYE